MYVTKNIFQHGIAATRVYMRKETTHQMRSISHHEVGQKEKETFKKMLDNVVDSIATHPNVAAVPDLKHWIKKLYTYNLTGGKLARGLSVVTAYEILERPENITEDSMRLARILGWCVEMFQTYLIIMDDIMDESSSRRGQPCWHLLPGVGTACAINDSLLIHNGMLYVLKKYFEERTNYKDMLNIINETMLFSAFGQFLDLKTSTNKYFKTFTPEKHLTIVRYKTAYYTYDLPIYLSYLLTGNKLDGKARKQVQDLNIDLGTLFQIQDDYIDCFGDVSLTGKSGTDIQEGKCSWLAVSALQRCNDAQRVVFNACYGSNEPAHVERIKQLYDLLRLPEIYRKVETQYYDGILEKIKDLPTDEWRRLYHNMLGVTYQRTK